MVNLWIFILILTGSMLCKGYFDILLHAVHGIYITDWNIMLKKPDQVRTIYMINNKHYCTGCSFKCMYSGHCKLVVKFEEKTNCQIMKGILET